MTNITPQQMRELADGRRTWMWHGDWDEEAEIALRTAADQLEAVDVTVLLEQRNAERRLVADLRAVIENAPHREKCRPHIACTCWKADAL